MIDLKCAIRKKLDLSRQKLAYPKIKRENEWDIYSHVFFFKAAPMPTNSRKSTCIKAPSPIYLKGKPENKIKEIKILIILLFRLNL